DRLAIRPITWKLYQKPLPITVSLLLLELEIEDQYDNLSDMVSANVSGRGTPNISGRDTPSSQITEGDDGRAAGEVRQLDLPPPNIPTKQSRSEIDDKFCKFEIKKLIEGDETVSMVSDTWSTDVLASDSEIVEQQDRILLAVPTEQVASVLPAEPTLTMLDISETASEAWSTDVLASDSERLTEVDTDDTASVARSDDTARSEIEIESRADSEGNEETLQSATPCPDGSSITFPSISGIREDSGIGTSIVHQPSPTTSPLPSSSNVTGRGGTKSDYRRSTMEYVDKNANNISNMDYDKPLRDDRLVHLIDKLQINNEKSQNGDVKTEELDSCMASVENTVGRLSTASVTSSSSSGSEPRVKSNISTSDLPTPTVNGICDVVDGSIPNFSKPNASTGAIPKSISFDMTAERGDKELLDDDQKNKRGFFGKLKLSLRNRRGKAIRVTDDRCFDREAGGDGVDVCRHRLRRIMSEDVTSSGNVAGDTTDDILAKYRRKPSAASDTASVESNQSRTKEVEDERLSIDPNNVELSYAFADAKRKLRM
ncbi:receptor-mediated endocytosis protein 6 homolog, partial [Temnothorax curvispinosus]|uniref:Receptor-mediated endocytosis protein 6 homolog n=1 Tax=Temnothorax curvispinosus TaxID=300111 RepID=A0A6J1QYB6_9HYME